MDKIVLLIGHPGRPEEYIPGVKKDIKSYKKFLMSLRWFPLLDSNKSSLSLFKIREIV